MYVLGMRTRTQSPQKQSVEQTHMPCDLSPDVLMFLATFNFLYHVLFLQGHLRLTCLEVALTCSLAVVVSSSHVWKCSSLAPSLTEPPELSHKEKQWHTSQIRCGAPGLYSQESKDTTSCSS